MAAAQRMAADPSSAAQLALLPLHLEAGARLDAKARLATAPLAPLATAPLATALTPPGAAGGLVVPRDAPPPRDRFRVAGRAAGRLPPASAVARDLLPR